MSVLVGCGNPGSPANDIANNTITNIGCQKAQSEMWNSLQHVSEMAQDYPSPEELKQALLQVGQKYGKSGPAFENYVNAFVDNYNTTISEIKQKFNPQSELEWKKALAAAEIGIQTTPAHQDLQAKVQPSMQKLENAEHALEAKCGDPGDGSGTGGGTTAGGGGGTTTPPPRDPASSGTSSWEQLKVKYGPEIAGMKKVLATAYQSCDVLNLKPMTSSTPKIAGVEVIGKHASGTGLVRSITQLADLVKTHYYIANNRLAKSSCFEVRKSPMIYDYGGKPYTTTTLPNELNMFKNGGSGQNTLGIDCSAFVFSSLAVGGLKLDPDPKKILKASLVGGVSSAALKEPQSNGMRCLQKISVSKTSSIKNGDIVAINGHVVMLDAVGSDPFGLNAITKSADCNSSKISYKNFDFVIAQSSSTKNGIGINRYDASDYLDESSTFSTGLTRYAVAACRAKFGLDPKLNSPDLSVVRHKKTAECEATPLVETNQACVEKCQVE